MEVNLHQFPEPTQCVLWDDPKLVRSTPMKELFELIDTHAHESHLIRYLLKCRECGQLYFFEFYEWVDWENGNDPQYSKYIPISTMEDAEMLKNAEPHDLLRFSPAINIDFPRDAEVSTIYWAGKVRPQPLPAPAPDASRPGSLRVGRQDAGSRGAGRVALLRTEGLVQGQHPRGRIHAVEGSPRFQAEVSATARADDAMPPCPERTRWQTGTCL